MLARANHLLARTGFAVARTDRLQELERSALRLQWMERLAAADPDSELPRSQLGQDLFVAAKTWYKREGFFVEFGAADGLLLSNTALLERSFGWRGILAEPARSIHGALQENRRCAIDTRCVWKWSGKRLLFSETEDSDFSTIGTYVTSDEHRDRRSQTAVDSYEVETVSLNDLLEEHDAPEQVDYLSIDTEGSEFEILAAYDFSREIGIITVEHNYQPIREQIHTLLTGRGFERVMPWMSQWDDWYLNRSLTPSGSG